MIQWMHQLSKSWAASLLMGALALSFIVWGIADVFTGVTSTGLATVGGIEISQQTFQRNYRNFVRNQSQQMGTEITPDMAQKLGLPMTALQQMISRTALDNIADKMGLTTSDATVAGFVRQQSAFRGVGGFDHDTFLRVIQGSGYNEDEFLAEMRGDMTRQQLTSALENNFHLADGYAGALFKFLNERRAVQFVILVPNAAGDVTPPPDAVLAAYVQAHATKYSTPEYRDVAFAQIAPEDMQGQVTVTPALIQQYYDEHKATYVVPEKRDIEQIEFASEADAKAARARIDSGTSFEAIAAEKKLKPADISLGTLAQGDLPDADRAKAAFALPNNQVSQPVKSALGGFVLIKVTKIAPGSSRSLADATDEIKKTVGLQLAAGKLVDIVNAYSDARGGGADLDAAAKKAGMKTGHAVVDRNGLTPAGVKADIPADPEFLTQAFATEVGEDSDPFAAKSGHYYAIKVNGQTPPKLKPLAAVKDAAIADWSNEQRGTLLAAKAQALAAQARKDGNLAAIAKSLGVSVQDSPGLSRGTNDTMFSSALVTQIFNQPPGGVVSAPQGLSGNFIIAKVTGISHPPAASAQYQAAQQQISASVAGDFSIAAANAGRDAQRVRVNRKLLDQTVGGGS